MMAGACCCTRTASWPAAATVADVDFTPWGRPLFVGHYHLLQEPYQVRGLIDDFKLWQRALSEAEIAAEAAGNTK